MFKEGEIGCKLLERSRKHVCELGEKGAENIRMTMSTFLLNHIKFLKILLFTFIYIKLQNFLEI